MKNYLQELVISILLMFTANSYAQTVHLNDKFIEKKEGWFEWKDTDQKSVARFLADDLESLGISPQNELILFKEETDALGITHKKYTQFHKGIPVEGGEIIFHESEGKLKTFNGKWVKHLNSSLPTIFSKEQAIAYALEALPAEKYLWEDEGAEKMLCQISNCKKESFYPSPELVWFNPINRLENINIQLCYKMEIQAEIPLMMFEVFINASTGEIVDKYSLLHNHSDVPATANTKYSGTQQITTDSIGPNMYRLKEDSRGGGIHTLNMKGGLLFGAAEDFYDDDNIWNNFNKQFDEVATDCHWAAEKTYDYMLEKHDYDGIDDQGMAYLSYVHYDSNVVNAFWNGSWASFGDGNGTGGWSPLTTIDVVAHEFAHGFTQNTARLVYRDESGALNESFSDIIGAAVEFYAIPDSADWLMAEDAQFNGMGFRSMINPNERGDPDTYKGENWFTREDDNGGVHTNSSVQNYWFYLLTEGGTGVNDNGTAYQVEGLGLDAAAKIAFRNLRYYLSRESQYIDAREGSLQAAADLYGPCSNEYVQTARAWQAVGLGDALQEFDIALKNINYPSINNCGLSESEFPKISIQYNACDSIIESDVPIPVVYQVDGGDLMFDTIELSNDFAGGEQLVFEANIPVTGLDGIGTHELKIWTAFDQDPNALNDTISIEIINEVDQNTDFAATDLISPVSSCFKNEESITVELLFEGCDSIPQGTSFEVYFALNGNEVSGETFTLDRTLYADEKYTVTFDEKLDFENRVGNTNFEAWVNFEEDEFLSNDSIDVRVIANPIIVSEGTCISFEFQEASLDSLYTLESAGSKVSTNVNTESDDGFFVLEMTGGDALNNRGELRVPNDINIWEVNERLIAKTCFCVDATNMTDVFMTFDLKQKYSISYRDVFGRDIPFASSLRLLADGEQISQTFNPKTYAGDPFVNHFFDLSEYAGSFVEMCFETRNWQSAQFDGIGVGDIALIDNIKIGSNLVSTAAVEQIERIKIHPNPVNNTLMIDLDGSFKGNVSIEIYNTLGQVVAVHKEKIYSNDAFINLDVKDLDPGIYSLLVMNEKEKEVKTFIKTE